MTLRDEIALAIGNIQCERWNLSPATKAEPIETWDGAFQAADAVLALLHNPTAEMVERVAAKLYNWKWDELPLDIRESYKSLARAALIVAFTEE